MLSTFPGLELIPPLSLHIAIAAVWVLVVLLIAWVVNLSDNSNPEIVRKIVHIGVGHVVLLAWWLDIPASIGILASILACGITLLSYVLPILPGINSVGRRSLGTFFYSFSIGVLVGWFWYLQQPQYAALGIMIMAWGDGLAALIGQRFGQHKYKILGAHKSWEGSLTMFLVSYLVSSVILVGTQTTQWQMWTISLVVAFIATVLEAFSFLGIDNLTVPLGSAGLAFILTQLLTIK